MSVRPSTWLRVYALHWQLMKEAVFALDEKALIHTLVRRGEDVAVAAKCNKMTGICGWFGMLPKEYKPASAVFC